MTKRQLTLPTVLLFSIALFSLSIPTAQAFSSGGITPSGPHVLTQKSCSSGDRHSAADHKRWTAKLIGAKTLPKKSKVRHQHFFRCPKGPNHRKAMVARWKRVKASLVPPLPANHSIWVRIGRCEQPGSGYAGINWSHGGPTYQGGLGIWYGNWDSLKPKGYPADAGQATWRQQMEVANRLAARYGFSAWGCY